MTKIAEPDLKEIEELRGQMSEVVSSVGQLTLEQQLLDEDAQRLKDKLKERTSDFKVLIEKEQALVKRLLQQYGAGSIDFETGEFTPES